MNVFTDKSAYSYFPRDLDARIAKGAIVVRLKDIADGYAETDISAQECENTADDIARINDRERLDKACWNVATDMQLHHVGLLMPVLGILYTGIKEELGPADTNLLFDAQDKPLTPLAQNLTGAMATQLQRFGLEWEGSGTSAPAIICRALKVFEAARVAPFYSMLPDEQLMLVKVRPADGLVRAWAPPAPGQGSGG